MVVFRKILGLLIILFFALPVLFGVIWAVGLTKAAISPEFVADIPQQVIDETPQVLEEIFEDAQDNDFVADRNTRTWFQTAAEVGVSPRQLMEETGLRDWMENELSQTLQELGDILRGKRRVRNLTIDLIPLKAALRHDAIDRYLEAILDRLPPCDDYQLNRWADAYDRDIDWFKLPPCRPNKEIALSVFRAERLRALEDMDSEIEIFSGVRYPALGISRAVTLFSYGIFIIPVLFLFAGAIIAATSPAGFCRWFGLSTIAAGLPALALAFFARQIIAFGFSLTPYTLWESGMSDLEGLVMEKIAWIPQLVIGHLFTEVVALAGTICIIGLVIFALSFVLRNESRTRTRPPKPVPAAVIPPEAAEPTKTTPEPTEPDSAAAETAEPDASESISAEAQPEKGEETKAKESTSEGSWDEESADEDAEEVVEKEKVPLPPPDEED
jgi:hypothetical protein